MGHGKTEAYFFPPLDVPPYNLQLGPVRTRLGLKPGVSKEKVGVVCGDVGVAWLSHVLSDVLRHLLSVAVP